MENELVSHIFKICQTLNENSVHYLIVGGMAVALHGYFRRSTTTSGQYAEKHDLDIWYNPTYENYFKLLNALENIGQDVKAYQEEQAPNPRSSYFRFELEQLTLDFLPKINGLSNFASSFQKKEIVRLNKIDIFFINYEDLIINKQANARPKDLEDIEQLKRIKNKK